MHQRLCALLVDHLGEDLTEGLGAIMHTAARALMAVPSERTFQSTYYTVLAMRHLRELASNDALRPLRVSIAQASDRPVAI